MPHLDFENLLLVEPQAKAPSECLNIMHTFEVYWYDKGCWPKFANNAILLVIGISALIITNFGSCHITEIIKEKIN